MIKSREGGQRKMKTAQSGDIENGSQNKLGVRIAVEYEGSFGKRKEKF